MPEKHLYIHHHPPDWKLPVNLAIGFHLLVMFCAMVLPGLLDHKTILPEVTTIDLVSMSEPAPPSGAKQPAKSEAKQEATPPKPAEVIKPEVTKQVPPPVEKAIPVPEQTAEAVPEPVTPVAPPEAISLKPLKQKVKKEIKELPDPKIEEVKKRQDELKNFKKQLQDEIKKENTAQETIKRQRLEAAAREDARRLELEARMAAADAKNALRDQLRATTGGAGSSQSPSTQPGTGSSQSMGVLEQQYYATIMGHIKQYWQPPDVKSWDPSLLAIVSITVAGDGQIVRRVFEQESGDHLFDQFVLKTLEAANPLPVPPPALQKQRLEVGLRFKPSGIQ